MTGKKEEPPQAQNKMAPKREEREPSQGDAAAATPGPPEHQSSRSGNPDYIYVSYAVLVINHITTVLKSGPLFLSSKGIGWTSWKKRWFILTHTSLVFFRSDPNSVSQKGNEVNLTLGGIDLNNSGSVVVKADKKLIIVQFNDGPDGRTFTLKAETMDDLYEWKAALENALSQAPSSANLTGQNGIFRNDQADVDDGSKEPVNDKQPAKSTVVGRPILLALEDVDGAPTFLEKALRYIEEHGVKVEGILRQAADVEDVERRIQEYEQGKTDFASEDAHVVADCVKYIIRELPSPPVPASCCKALLDACRTQHGSRVNAMRAAVLDTFPEPNCRLLQRILMMMQVVASHKNQNLMSTSAVAACMAPLLLRPLLSGDCEIEMDFDVGSNDSSMQLLQAAAAANHAQAIVITLLEQYDHIFGEGSISSQVYTDTDESASGSEEEADDDDDESGEEDESCEDDDGTEGSDVSNDDEDDEDDDEDDNDEESGSESGQSVTNDRDVNKDSGSSSSSTESSESDEDVKATKTLPSSTHNLPSQNDDLKSRKDYQTKLEDTLAHQNQTPHSKQSTAAGSGPDRKARRNAVWGRTAAKKNLSMESTDVLFEEEIEIEAENSDLQNRRGEETEGNAKLEARMERRKKALQDRCRSLEKDVARLKEELQRERDKRKALESGLNSSQEPRFLPDKIDEKTKATLKDIAQAETDITNLKQKVKDLQMQLKQQQGTEAVFKGSDKAAGAGQYVRNH
ncbi:rho GTPase-activating protein REN1-like [Hibiscus syriacus]|uniref:rho GTPase-activating protein REN1-like n=1 Tax=Hibiscus syriacus TaxID=106335 RepID=UPI001920F922|nr:rho GTPase-activating protein REN1-like [Hibiscus syriacus]